MRRSTSSPSLPGLSGTRGLVQAGLGIAFMTRRSVISFSLTGAVLISALAFAGCSMNAVATAPAPDVSVSGEYDARLKRLAAGQRQQRQALAELRRAVLRNQSSNASTNDGGTRETDDRVLKALARIEQLMSGATTSLSSGDDTDAGGSSDQSTLADIQNAVRTIEAQQRQLALQVAKPQQVSQDNSADFEHLSDSIERVSASTSDLASRLDKQADQQAKRTRRLEGKLDALTRLLNKLKADSRTKVPLVAAQQSKRPQTRSTYGVCRKSCLDAYGEFAGGELYCSSSCTCQIQCQESADAAACKAYCKREAPDQ